MDCIKKRGTAVLTALLLAAGLLIPEINALANNLPVSVYEITYTGAGKAGQSEYNGIFSGGNNLEPGVGIESGFKVSNQSQEKIAVSLGVYEEEMAAHRDYQKLCDLIEIKVINQNTGTVVFNGAISDLLSAEQNSQPPVDHIAGGETVYYSVAVDISGNMDNYFQNSELIIPWYVRIDSRDLDNSSETGAVKLPGGSPSTGELIDITKAGLMIIISLGVIVLILNGKRKYGGVKFER